MRNPSCTTRPRVELLLAVLFVFCLFACALPAQLQAEECFALDFSTYVGGTNWEHARDVFADANGCVYMVGGTSSTNFPVTPGAYDMSFNGGGPQAFGGCDAFVTKFDTDGSLVWATYLGGPFYDRAYAVEVDSQGFVYVAGRAGPGFPVTPGAFQTTYQGPPGNRTSYGDQNAFVAKLTPDGSNLVWASYVGVSSLCRDMAIDEDGNVYLPLGFPNAGRTPPAAWFANAFQKAPRGSTDCGVIKVSSDGSNVLWATWLGGSRKESEAASVRVDHGRNVYLLFNTQSTDMPTTPGVHDGTHNGGEDGFAAKLSPDGSTLIYGTYLGGSGTEWSVDTHTLAVDRDGNAYANMWTDSADYPTTEGAYDRTLGGSGDIAITKLSPTGSLVHSSFIGGSSGDNSDGIYVDRFGNVFLSGVTSSSDFPVTSGAYQAVFGGDHDAVLVRLSADFSHLIYSTYMGKTGYDNGRSGFLGDDGALYITGATNGSDWPTANAFQGDFGGGRGNWGNGDCILAKFVQRRSAK